MTALIERLEAAAEGSRELDSAIAWQMGFDWRGSVGQQWRDFYPNADESNRSRMANNYGVPHYTTSLDAALTLAPEGIDYELTINGTQDNKTFTCASLRWWDRPREENQKDWKHRNGNKLSPALALCVACLRARAAK